MIEIILGLGSIGILWASDFTLYYIINNSRKGYIESWKNDLRRLTS